MIRLIRETLRLPQSPQFASRPILNRTVAETFLERHFTIQELAEMWAIGRETVRLLSRTNRMSSKSGMGRKVRTPGTVSPNLWPRRFT